MVWKAKDILVNEVLIPQLNYDEHALATTVMLFKALVLESCIQAADDYHALMKQFTQSLYDELEDGEEVERYGINVEQFVVKWFLTDSEIAQAVLWALQFAEYRGNNPLFVTWYEDGS